MTDLPQEVQTLLSTDMAQAADLSTFVPLASGLAGAVIAALVALLGAWIQGRGEHARWLRERRYETYVAALSFLRELDGLEAEVKRNANALVAVVRQESGAEKLVAALESDSESLVEREKAARARLGDVSSAFELLGPNSLVAAFVALSLAEAGNAKEAARGKFIIAARKALNIND